MLKQGVPSLARRRGLGERLQEGLRRTGRGFVTQVLPRVLLAAFILVAGYFLLEQVRKYVTGLERFQVSPATLKFTRTPAWVTPKVQEQLACAPDLPERFSLLEPGLARRVAEAYRHNPWVADVPVVERRFPNCLKVHLLLRQPMAVVRYRGVYHLVDGEGVRLPLQFGFWPHPDFQLPVIIGATTEPPKPGSAWPDESVRAACAIARLLAAQNFDRPLAVTTIDASNLGGRASRTDPDIILQTASRTRILWGRSPLAWQPGDGSQTVGRKLAYLKRLAECEDLGRLDYADIRYDRLLVKDRS
jgi:cell division septal protein FtsQ